ncbi:EF-hand domain-containing protein [Paludisphaera soli]|uniref:EF-hand domain-containing protein n=1 Tax=Paludisphaera soli TaxID=2712865 RepID=UPI0013EB1966|nr:EF-hand domain-containing protein [Paludisphaera soli]
MPLRNASKAGLALFTLSLALVGRSFGEEPKAGPARRLGELFADLDVDNDGALDSKEVAANEKPAFGKLLARGDSDKDGRIDKAEFDALVKKVAAARKAEGKAKPKKAAKKAEAPKAEEAKAAEAEPAESGPAMKVERARALIERFRTQDADKDGKLSREEFRGRPAAFDRLDVDGDGHLDKADLKVLRSRQKADGGGKGEKAKAEDKVDAAE